jgi:hypothetical protein
MGTRRRTVALLTAGALAMLGPACEADDGVVDDDPVFDPAEDDAGGGAEDDAGGGAEDDGL